MNAVPSTTEQLPHVPFTLIDTDRCPTCDQTIPPEKIAAVRGRHAAHERELGAAITARFERLRADDQANAARELENVRANSASAVAAAEAQVIDAVRSAEQRTRAAVASEYQQQIAQKVTELTTQRELSERDLRTQLSEALDRQRTLSDSILALTEQVESNKKQADQQLEALQAQHQENLARQLGEQATTIAATHKEQIDELRSRIDAAANERRLAVEEANAAATEREALAATRLTEANNKVATLQAEKISVEERFRAADAAKEIEIANIRTLLEADKNTAVLAEQSKRFQETQKLSADLDDLRRKLEKKTADELGEGAELALFEELKHAFPGDLFREVKRGQQGADIIHEIRENGAVIGKIVYDCKNRKRWETEYATKLRADQIAEQAHYAILSSNKFPAGTKQLHLFENVIIACPARVLALTSLLREQLVTMHTLRVSNEERADKTAKLYEFMTSPRFSQLLDSVGAQVEKLEQIDADERKAHDSVWTKRGKTFKAIAKANADLRFEVNQIVGVHSATSAVEEDSLV